jgi:hypothetical protein
MAKTAIANGGGELKQRFCVLRSGCWVLVLGSLFLVRCDVVRSEREPRTRNQNLRTAEPSTENRCSIINGRSTCGEAYRCSRRH